LSLHDALPICISSNPGSESLRSLSNSSGHLANGKNGCQKEIRRGSSKSQGPSTKEIPSLNHQPRRVSGENRGKGQPQKTPILVGLWSFTPPPPDSPTCRCRRSRCERCRSAAA